MEKQGSGRGTSEESTSGSLVEKLGLFLESLCLRDENEKVSLLREASVTGVAEYLGSGKCSNVIVMVGAGMSTSAGVPDFRSPGSGIYANLQQYDLPSPESMFDISYFRQHPEPFFQLARQLFPVNIRPTPSHFFLKLLHEKGLLKRIYTQNIDCLERAAGIPDEQIVEAHGSFHASHCLNSSCHKEYSSQWLKEQIFSGEQVQVPKCEACASVVKPDIVFFGERLPDRFFTLMDQDFGKCDLLIVIGTSLTVQPFASLVELVPKHVPRLVVNLTPFRSPSKIQVAMGMAGSSFDFDSGSNGRDVFMQGMCDDMCRQLADKLGWSERLEELIAPDAE